MTGKYFDELEVGQKIAHPRGRTVTETENVLFCGLTENTQPLHLDDEFAKKSGFQGRIVNGLFTLSLVVGMTVPDLTEGTIVGNLGYERVDHPEPVYAGDTLSAETEVLEKRPSESKPDRGIVKLRHVGRNQEGAIVVEVDRTVMFLRKP